MTDKYGSSDDTMGSAPTVDVDSAGRGQGMLEGEPGINVVRSIGQDDYMDYSNKSSDPGSGSGAGGKND